MILITLVTAVLSSLTAIAVFWLNPRRPANQAFSIVSLIQSVWLACIYQAVKAGATAVPNPALLVEPWLRANAAVVSFLPWGLMLLKASISATASNPWHNFVHTWKWLLLAFGLVALCYTDSFFVWNDVKRPSRGFAYYLHGAIAIGCCITCVAQVSRNLPHVTGIRRVELQFLSLTAGITAALVATLNTVGNILSLRALNRATLLIIFFAYTVVACALLFHRVFNARQVFARVAQKSFVLAVICIGIIFIPNLLAHLIPMVMAQIVAILGCVSLGVWLNHLSKQWLGLDDEVIIGVLRKSAVDCALEGGSPGVVAAFEALLRSHFHAERAVLQAPDSACNNVAVRLEPGTSEYQLLARTGWATPESLQRRRASPESTALREFLLAHDLGVAVAVPRGSTQPSLIVALGTKTNAAPFTYPEVVRLQNVAELMDNVLIRSQLTTQAALRAKLEHLAMMSRGLAHDLKNLITPISSYLEFRQPRLAADGSEYDSYRSARRSVEIMSDYVSEALFFSERMEPQFEPMELRRVVLAAREVCLPRAQLARVDVDCEIAPMDPMIGDAVLLQRMLANLVANAIDASPPGSRVDLTASLRDERHVRIQVVDRGCGIPAEHLERIFDPYFTTKQYGETVRGFGLGLTITQKIADLHGGSIHVKSARGEGATVTIDLPRTPPSAHPAGPITLERDASIS